MKWQRFSEDQIIGTIKQHESGMKIDTLCQDLGIGDQLSIGRRFRCFIYWMITPKRSSDSW